MFKSVLEIIKNELSGHQHSIGVAQEKNTIYVSLDNPSTAQRLVCVVASIKGVSLERYERLENLNVLTEFFIYG